ncbi:hypothetical protein [Flavobacterium sp. RSP49]|uniref:hypothetical protein n=1 Tax=Flavobacterium sp. RSP49 TaxID=2497487 RepID=UPI0018FE9AB0|nr:hypothetical protein [Flavobacterium sp. RSP49]
MYKDNLGTILGMLIVGRDSAKQKWALDLKIANNELAFQNKIKETRADELVIANEELAFQNNEKEERADELVITNKELLFQSIEKEKREIVNKKLAELTYKAK